jgi:hypothetical protein
LLVSGGGGDWWTRSYEAEYLPVLSLEDGQLESFMQQQGWLAAARPAQRTVEGRLPDILALFRGVRHRLVLVTANYICNKDVLQSI